MSTLNRWVISARKKCEPIFDRIWPSVTPKYFGEIKRQLKKEKVLLKSDVDTIDEMRGKTPEIIGRVYKELLCKVEEDEKRNTRVETKLATLFVLCAVSASLVLSAIGWTAANIHWAVLLMAGYCLLQLVITLHAVTSGLRRQSYSSPKISELVSVWIGDDEAHTIDLMKSVVEGYHEAQGNTNKKVTQLEIAHTAFVNFLFGVVILFAFSLMFSKHQPSTKDMVNTILDEVEKRPQIQELLHGRSRKDYQPNEAQKGKDNEPKPSMKSPDLSTQAQTVKPPK